MTDEECDKIVREVERELYKPRTYEQWRYADLLTVQARERALVRAAAQAEREACAKVCNELEKAYDMKAPATSEEWAYQRGHESGANECAAAIRAR